MGVEVGAALAAAHGEGGQRVLQDLLKAEELDNGEVDGGMETETALVRSDCGVELNTVAAVYVGNAVVVDPGNTEHDHALRLNKALDEASLLPFGVLVNDELEALENFTDSLKELGLIGVALLNVCVYTLEVFVGNHRFFSPVRKIKNKHQGKDESPYFPILIDFSTKPIKVQL